MFKLTRTQFAGGLAAGLATGIRSYPAGAAEFAFKLGNDTPASHPVHVYATRAAAKIKDETGGRVEILTFANSALGAQVNMVSQVRLGALEFMCMADNIVQAVVPVMAITGVPFAFSGYEQAWGIMRGPFGKFLRDQVRKADVGFVSFDETWDAGFRQMLNGVRPLQGPGDLKGLRMRTPPNELEISMFKAFGAAATSVPGHEMYTALQTHLVDGLDGPLVGIETNKQYEVSKYVTILNHIWTRYSMYVNVKTWATIPKPLQDIIERNFNAAAVAERTEVAQGETAIEATLKTQGMAINRPAIPPFKKALQDAGFYRQCQDGFGRDMWAMFERTVGKLA